jgi:hypothetical protein
MRRERRVVPVDVAVVAAVERDQRVSNAVSAVKTCRSVIAPVSLANASLNKRR